MSEESEAGVSAAAFAAMAGSLNAVWYEQLALCDMLEALADGLPDRADRGMCLEAAEAISGLLARAHRLEESVLFANIARYYGRCPGLSQIISRLRHDHIADQAYAEELHDALTAHGRGLAKPSAETLGYMLRAFFENIRRHIRFDMEVLLPLLTSGEPDVSADKINRSGI
ncbi:hemerythrin domain-containing protein [Phyllobacterium phragmitis]|nr:hemerythrin domain-containing protein [Phyllobacterium phragmitis]